MARLPRTPELPLVRRPGDLPAYRLRRAVAGHATAGPHVTPWNRLRYFGPTTSRFDAAAPAGVVGAWVSTDAATDVVTCLAEVFAASRGRRRAAGAVRSPAAADPALTLLDLTATWPIRNGASHLLTSGPKSVCRAWARAVDTEWHRPDGLWSVSR